MHQPDDDLSCLHHLHFLNPIHGTLINLTTLPTQNLDPWTGIGPSSCLNNESARLRRDATATQCDLPRRGTIPSFWSLVAMSAYVVCARSVLHETTAGLWFAPPMQARRGWGVWELNLDWVGHEVQWTVGEKVAVDMMHPKKATVTGTTISSLSFFEWFRFTIEHMDSHILSDRQCYVSTHPDPIIWSPDFCAVLRRLRPQMFWPRFGGIQVFKQIWWMSGTQNQIVLATLLDFI